MKIRRSRGIVFTSLWQACALFVLGATIGLLVNQVRSSNLPLFSDQPSISRAITDPAGNLIITIDEAQKLFFSGKALFLDARCPELYREKHIRGAINLPWEDVDQCFDRIMAGVPHDTIIIAYCDGEGCDLGEELALELYYRGYENARVLMDGLYAWEKHKLPLEKAADASGSG